MSSYDKLLRDWDMAQKRAVSAARSRLRAVFSMYLDAPDDVFERELRRTYAALVDTYGDAVAAKAAEVFEAMRPDSLGRFTAELAAKMTDEEIVQELSFARKDATRRITFGEAVGALQVSIVGQGRKTMAQNINRDRKNGVRWARVPSGPVTCAFCAVLASRGWVYASEEKAGARGNAYHAHCDCKIVPSWGAKNARISGYDPDRLYAEYMGARDSLTSRLPSGSKIELKDVVAEMRGMYPGRYTDSAEVPAFLRDKEHGWPSDRFAPVRPRVYRHIFKRHGADGTAHDLFDEPDPQVVSTRLLETISRPDGVFPSGKHRAVSNYYRIIDGELFVAGVKSTQGSDVGEVVSFMQAHEGGHRWKEWREWKQKNEQ
ncbi:hypothetical protein [Trueperella pyogenes]|uniref:VG15 protein n=2 Tax=Trueperella pyogenes TaxID=1661 RepID=UPI003F5348F1